MDRYTYKVLRYVEREHMPVWSDVLNHFHPKRLVNRTDRILRSALDRGFIQITDQASPPLCRVKLMPAGEVAILDYIGSYLCWYTNEIRAWLTLAIAVAALVVSILALVSG